MISCAEAVRRSRHRAKFKARGIPPFPTLFQGVSGSIHSSQPSNLIFSTYVPRFEMLQQVHNISDTDASVSNVQFLDEDLDKFELAGCRALTQTTNEA